MATVSTPSQAHTPRKVEAGQAGRSRLGAIIFYVVLVLCALFFLMPLAWMIVTSLKPNAEWLTPNWIPKQPTWDNFRSVFQDPTLPVWRWFLNSFVVATLFTVLILLIDSLAAYAYARMEF